MFALVIGLVASHMTEQNNIITLYITGQHNQHYMLRIARPATDWPCGGPSGRGGQWANPMSGPRGHGWWGPGSGMRKWWRNLMRQQPGCNGK